MIGIVESGATKSEWLFIDKDKKRYRNRTVGFNPFYQSVDDIYKTLKEELLPNLEFSVPIEKISFYGAGCEAEANRQKIRDAFKRALPNTIVDVQHDLLAAARALFGDKPGIACIAGTGSNTCYYDGKDVVRNVHSLGLFLGDEGSGGHKGKILIREYIREGLPANLRKQFEETYPDRTDVILEKIYSGDMPSRYLASFAPFLHKNIADPFIYKIVHESFDNMFDRMICRYENHKDVTIGFVGSVAFHFREVLDKVAASKGVKVSIVDPSPSEALVKYHLDKEHA
jgi:glucosamine kinase